RSPLLVRPAVAGPDDHLGAVGGPGVVHVQAQSRLAVRDRAASVDVPLLRGSAAAVRDDRRGAGAGPAARGVQAPPRVTGVDGQLACRGAGPLLVGLAVAVPDLQLGP